MPNKNPFYVDKLVLSNGGQIEEADWTAIVSVSATWVITQAAALYKDVTTTLTAVRTILASETGTVFFFGSSTEFAMTLPAVATSAWLHYTFICTASASWASYTIVSSGSENKICGLQVNKAGTAGSYIADWDTITFTDWQATVWDMVELYCDWNLWYAYSISNSATWVVISKAS